MAGPPAFDPAEYERSAIQQGQAGGVTLSTGGPPGPAPPAGAGGGFDPAEFEAFKQQPAPQGQGAPASGVLPEAGRVLQTGTLNAVANLAGLPVDVVNTVISAYNKVNPMRFAQDVEVPQIPIGGREQVKGAFQEAGISGTPPQTGPGRVAARTVEEVGTNVPLAAAGAVAGLPGKLGELSRAVGGLKIGDLVKLESIISAGSGLAAGVGREVSKNPLVELGAQLVGAFGTAGAMGVLDFFRRRLPSATAAGARGEVSRFMAQAVPQGSQYERNLQEGIGISQRMPEAGVTTAQATGSSRLRSLMGDLAAEAPDVGPRIAEQPAQGTRAMQGAVEQAVGAPQGDVAATQAAVRGQLQQRQAATQATAKAQEAGLASQRAAIQGQVDTLARGARAEAEQALRDLPTVDRDAAGRIITRVLETEGTKVKQVAGKLFDRIPSGVELDPANLRSSVDDVVSESTRGLRTREELGRTIPRLQAKLNPMTAEGEVAPLERASFGEVRKWRSDVLDELRQETSSRGGDPEKIRALTRIGDALDETLDQAGQASQQYREASAAYKDYVQRFRQGFVAQVMQTGPRGEKLAKPVEDVARAFFRSGTQAGAGTSARNFVSAVGNVPEARNALVGAAVEDFSQHVSRNGKVSSQLAERWLAAHKEAIDVFPEVGQAVRGVVARAQRAESAEDFARQTQRFLEGRGMKPAGLMADDALGRAATRTTQDVEDAAVRAFAGADAGRAIKTILRGDNRAQKAQELVAMVGKSPEAMNGLRRAFVDEMQARSAAGKAETTSRSPLFNPTAYRRFLEQNGDVARVLFPGKALDDLQTLQRVGEVVMSPMAADTNPSLLKGISRQALFTFDALLSRAYNVRRGMVSPQYTLTDVTARFIVKQMEKIGQENLRVVMDQALFDPEAASLLVRAGREALRNDATIDALNGYARRVAAGSAVGREVTGQMSGRR